MSSLCGSIFICQSFCCLPGRSLSEVEDAEEAQVIARLAFYEESLERRVHRRIFDLILDTAGGGTAAERAELAILQGLVED
jgi:hypothetical protein